MTITKKLVLGGLIIAGLVPPQRSSIAWPQELMQTQALGAPCATFFRPKAITSAAALGLFMTLQALMAQAPPSSEENAGWVRVTVLTEPPWILRGPSPDGKETRSYDFTPDQTLLQAIPHFAKDSDERSLARDINRMLQKSGPLPLPVIVVFGLDANKEPDIMGGVVRIQIQDGDGVLQQGAAIVLNTPYWERLANEGIRLSNRVVNAFAMHESEHTWAVWQLIPTAIRQTEELLTWIKEDVKKQVDRDAIQQIVMKADVAGEEVGAIDVSLKKVALAPEERTLFNRQRNHNILLRDQAINELLKLLPGVQKDAKAKKNWKSRLKELLDVQPLHRPSTQRQSRFAPSAFPLLRLHAAA